MKRSTWVGAWCAGVLAVGAAVTACQVVAKLETRNADPLGPGVGEPCKLPATGNGRVRAANLVPSKTNADLCIRQSGTSDWGRPILRNSGLDPICQAGFPYRAVSAPVAVPAGKLDFKVIPSGGPCSQPATSELDGVTVPDATIPGNSVVTLVRLGGGTAKVPEKLIALPEDSAPNSNELLLRVVNAIPGGPSIVLGTASLPQGTNVENVSLPVDMGSVLFPKAVPFGQVEPAGASLIGGSPIDAQGYLSFLIAGFPFVLAADGQTRALVAWYQPPGAATLTVYAVGDPGDPAFPVHALVCDDNTADPKNPQFELCQETRLPTLAAETLNVGLYGANAPNEAPRRDAIVSAVSTDDADFMCLLETGEQVTHDRLVPALQQAGLQYLVDPRADLSTPATDPTDWKNQTPAPQLANPPCGGSVPTDVFNAAYGCVVNKCSTKPGDESGELQGSTTCISSQCTSQFLPLYNDPAKYGQCFLCMLSNISTHATFSTTKTNCTTDTRYPMGFGGASTQILASRFPFAKKQDGSDDVDVYFLPTTGFRRGLLGARVLPDPTNPATTVDVYCGFTSSPLIISYLPYVGNYANGRTYPDEKSGTNGWRDEQNLQITRIIQHVKDRSGSAPVILMGDWHASVQEPTDPGAAQHTIGNQSPEALQLLETAFTPAHVSGWNFPCQYCPAVNASNTPNPYNTSGFAAGVQGYDFLTTYLTGSGFQASSTTEETIKFTEDVVSYDPTDATKKGPLGEYYARRVRILRPQ